MEKHGALIELLLAAAVAAVVAGAWRLESRSVLAERIRNRQTSLLWTAVDAPGRGAPLFTLAILQPAKRSLDVVLIPDDAPLGPKETAAEPYAKALARGRDARAAAAEACARQREALLSLPSLARLDAGPPLCAYEKAASLPEGDEAAAAKARIARRHAGPLFWKSLPGLLRRPFAGGRPGPEAALDALAYALEVHRLPPGAIRAAWLPAGPARERLLARLLDPAPRRPAEQPERPVTAEVYNATAVKGIAKAATDLLRLRGADAVILTREKPEGGGPGTVVYDRVGRVENALTVRAMLGCGSAEAVTRVKEPTLVDVTVVLREDCAGPLAKADPEER